MESQIPTIQTPRLLLRPLQNSDAEVLFRINQEEGVLRYFPNPVAPPLEKVQRFVTMQKAHWDTHGFGNWGIQPVGEQEIIGWAGLQFLPELNEVEVGYLLSRRFWGQGYATEAACASLQFGFATSRLNDIIALVHAENTASRRVLEKCGLQYVETIHLWGIDLQKYRMPNRYQ